jgi:hypothetical protein
MVVVDSMAGCMSGIVHGCLNACFKERSEAPTERRTIKTKDAANDSDRTHWTS